MDHERELFRRLIDEQLPPEEFQAVEERLLADPEFRARYVRYMDLEASLYAELATARAHADAGSHEGAVRQESRRGLWAVAGVAAAAVAAILVVSVALHRRGSAPRAQYVEAMLRGMEAAAIVTHVEGLAPQEQNDRPLKPGVRLKPGVLVLRQGSVQLEFLSGAKVRVQGPAELHILSAEAATLVSGQAAAQVLQWGQGFVLNTPEAAFVDLGTEFALGVDQQHGSELQVVDGEVEVSLLGEDGNTLVSERVTESKSLRVRPGAARLESSRGSSIRLLRIVDLAAAPLRVPARYRDAVLESEPLIYWRFDSAQDGLVPNEAGPKWAARLHDSGDSALLRVEQGVARFSPGNKPRYIAADEPIPKLNGEAFTIEFWVNADMLHWATLLGIVPADDPESVNHLNVIELAHRTSLVHEAGAFRFLHRHPPTKSGGVNVFTPNGCTPGQWHHLVAVKTSEELLLYLDGKLQRRLSGTMGEDPSDYRLFLGQLRTSTPDRQLSGAIDEFALYLRALSESEVRGHYRALTGSSGVGEK